MKLNVTNPDVAARLRSVAYRAIVRVGNIDVDIIDATFDVSISTILSYKSIDRGIDDTLLAFFIDITSILLN